APQWFALVGIVALLAARIIERWNGLRSGSRPKRPAADLEFGSLLVAVSFVLVEMTGGPTGPAYPMVYAIMAFLMAFHPLGAGLYFIGLVLGTELVLTWFYGDAAIWQTYIYHVLFNVLFASLYVLFLRGE